MPASSEVLKQLADSAITERDSALQRYEQACAEISGLKRSNDAYVKRIRTCELEIESYKTKVHDLEEQIVICSTDDAGFQKRLAAVREEVEQRSSGLERENALLNQRLHELQQKYDLLVAERPVLVDQSSMYRTAADNFGPGAGASTLAISMAATGAHDSPLAEAQARIAELQLQLESLRGAVREHEAARQKAEEDARAYQSDMVQYLEDNKALVDTVGRLEADCAELTAQRAEFTQIITLLEGQVRERDDALAERLARPPARPDGAAEECIPLAEHRKILAERDRQVQMFTDLSRRLSASSTVDGVGPAERHLLESRLSDSATTKASTKLEYMREDNQRLQEAIDELEAVVRDRDEEVTSLKHAVARLTREQSQLRRGSPQESATAAPAAMAAAAGTGVDAGAGIASTKAAANPFQPAGAATRGAVVSPERSTSGADSLNVNDLGLSQASESSTTIRHKRDMLDSSACAQRSEEAGPGPAGGAGQPRRDDVHILREECDQYLSQVNYKSKEVRELRVRVQRQLAELADKAATIAELERRLAELQQRADEFASAREGAEQEAARLQQALADARVDGERQAETLRGSEQRVTDLTGDLTVLRSKNAEHDATILSLQGQLGRLQEENLSLNTLYEQTYKDFQATLAERQRVDVSRAELEGLIDDLKERLREEEAKSSALAENLEQVACVSQQKDAALQRGRDAEAEAHTALRAEHAALQARLREQEALGDDARRAQDEALEKVRACTRENAALQAAVDRLGANDRDLTTQVAVLTERCRGLAEQLASATAELAAARSTLGEAHGLLRERDASGLRAKELSDERVRVLEEQVAGLQRELGAQAKAKAKGGPHGLHTLHGGEATLPRPVASKAPASLGLEEDSMDLADLDSAGSAGPAGPAGSGAPVSHEVHARLKRDYASMKTEYRQSISFVATLRRKYERLLSSYSGLRDEYIRLTGSAGGFEAPAPLRASDGPGAGLAPQGSAVLAARAAEAQEAARALGLRLETLSREHDRVLRELADRDKELLYLRNALQAGATDALFREQFAQLTTDYHSLVEQHQRVLTEVMQFKQLLIEKDRAIHTLRRAHTSAGGGGGGGGDSTLGQGQGPDPDGGSMHSLSVFATPSAISREPVHDASEGPAALAARGSPRQQLADMAKVKEELLDQAAALADSHERLKERYALLDDTYTRLRGEYDAHVQDTRVRLAELDSARRLNERLTQEMRASAEELARMSARIAGLEAARDALQAQARDALAQTQAQEPRQPFESSAHRTSRDVLQQASELRSTLRRTLQSLERSVGDLSDSAMRSSRAVLSGGDQDLTQADLGATDRAPAQGSVQARPRPEESLGHSLLSRLSQSARSRGADDGPSEGHVSVDLLATINDLNALLSLEQSRNALAGGDRAGLVDKALAQSRSLERQALLIRDKEVAIRALRAQLSGKADELAAVLRRNAELEAGVADAAQGLAAREAEVEREVAGYRERMAALRDAVQREQEDAVRKARVQQQAELADRFAATRAAELAELRTAHDAEVAALRAHVVDAGTLDRYREENAALARRLAEHAQELEAKTAELVATRAELTELINRSLEASEEPSAAGSAGASREVFEGALPAESGEAATQTEVWEPSGPPAAGDALSASALHSQIAALKEEVSTLTDRLRARDAATDAPRPAALPARSGLPGPPGPPALAEEAVLVSGARAPCGPEGAAAQRSALRAGDRLDGAQEVFHAVQYEESPQDDGDQRLNPLLRSLHEFVEEPENVQVYREHARLHAALPGGPDAEGDVPVLTDLTAEKPRVPKSASPGPGLGPAEKLQCLEKTVASLVSVLGEIARAAGLDDTTASLLLYAARLSQDAESVSALIVSVERLARQLVAAVAEYRHKAARHGEVTAEVEDLRKIHEDLLQVIQNGRTHRQHISAALHTQVASLEDLRGSFKQKLEELRCATADSVRDALNEELVAKVDHLTMQIDVLAVDRANLVTEIAGILHLAEGTSESGLLGHLHRARELRRSRVVDDLRSDVEVLREEMQQGDGITAKSNELQTRIGEFAATVQGASVATVATAASDAPDHEYPHRTTSAEIAEAQEVQRLARDLDTTTRSLAVAENRVHLLEGQLQCAIAESQGPFFAGGDSGTFANLSVHARAHPDTMRLSAAGNTPVSRSDVADKLATAAGYEKVLLMEQLASLEAENVRRTEEALMTRRQLADVEADNARLSKQLSSLQVADLERENLKKQLAAAEDVKENLRMQVNTLRLTLTEVRMMLANSSDDALLTRSIGDLTRVNDRVVELETEVNFLKERLEHSEIGRKDMRARARLEREERLQAERRMRHLERKYNRLLEHIDESRMELRRIKDAASNYIRVVQDELQRLEASRKAGGSRA